MTDARFVSRQVARRFLVLRHLLAPPRAVRAGPAGVMAVVERLGSLQFDPLAVAGRNHDLVLHARVAGYDPAWTEALLYERRALFETWNKALSLLPMHELPWYRIGWDRDRAIHEADTFVAHRDIVDHVLARIRAEGPLSSLDFESGPAIDWYWGPTNKVRAVLEALSEAGILGLARRAGNRRYYDLMERLVPAELLSQQVTERDQLRHKLLSRYRGHGLLGTGGQVELFGGIRPSRVDGKPQAGAPLRAELRAELVAEGSISMVEVDGVRGQRFVLSEELPLLDQAEQEVATGTPPGGAAPGVTFLAPLDQLVWDRDFLRAAYDFDYVWEVYVPEGKRRWGYYVLPLLFGDRLVGRIEPRIDRTTGTVRILGLWWETGFQPRREEGFVDAMRDALRAYLEFGGATAIDWTGQTARWGRSFGLTAKRRSASTSRPKQPPRTPVA